MPERNERANYMLIKNIKCFFLTYLLSLTFVSCDNNEMDDFPSYLDEFSNSNIYNALYRLFWDDTVPQNL